MPAVVSEGPRARPARPMSWWHRFWSRRVEVHDESMAPTLLPGDRLLVDVRAYRKDSVAPGDLLVVIDPEQSDRWLVKRAAGVGPGRFFRTPTGLAREPADDSGEPILLPAGTVYVTGEAPRARDSGRFGPIPLRAVVGRVYYRYAPADRRRAF